MIPRHPTFFLQYLKASMTIGCDECCHYSLKTRLRDVLQRSESQRGVQYPPAKAETVDSGGARLGSLPVEASTVMRREI